MELTSYLFQWATEPDSSWDPQDAAVALTAAGFEGATELSNEAIRAVCGEFSASGQSVLIKSSSWSNSDRGSRSRSWSRSGSLGRSGSWFSSWSMSWLWERDQSCILPRSWGDGTSQNTWR
jgi:hypothetical protein